jgi:nitrite reductase/ring-hydroxylating ferredoxin subunit
MSETTAICRAEDVPEGCARGFIIGEGRERRDVVLVRRLGVLRAYLNSCPHQGTPLETFPDKFLSNDGKLFVCSTHGARFRVDDGVCISGPCLGKALLAIDPIVGDDGWVGLGGTLAAQSALRNE